MDLPGLSSQEAATRLVRYGKNLIDHKRSFVGLKIFLSQFPTFINLILLLAASFFFFTNDTIDGIFILTIIILNGLFGFAQEYKAEKSLEKLKTYTQAIVRVIRDGIEQEVSSVNLVPGDVVILDEGERIPADGKLLKEHSIEVDESILTGESLPVEKKGLDPLFSGTLIAKGKGVLVVEQTGMHTRFGQIAQSLATIEQEKTPLQKNLTTLGRIISLLALGIALLLVPLEALQGKELLPILLIAISIGIAAIPEGLPAVITIALAIGTNRMAKRNAIVRQMPAIETLGATQIILTDKTGTLTENSMRVRKYYLREERFFTKLVQACVLGNTASLIQKGQGMDIVGDKTDGSLLVWVKEHHRSIKDIIKLGNVIDEHVFDVARKTITTVWEFESKKHIFVRGAPEVILDHSILSDKEKMHITALYETYAKEGLRVIAFGTKTQRFEGKKSRDELEEKLTFLGFVGIYDPPRKEAKKAVLDAAKAGIKVMMVTGDNEFTALAIGKEIGLLQADEDVLTGEELAKLSDEELLLLLSKVRIFARTRPEDKLRLVTLLKKQGYVVGVTGDGVNDALALKKADVGIAMGQTGTDVAKEASDIVLADDNFATLIRAIEEGRTIYHNIVKAVTYLLTGNLSELALVFLGSMFGLPTPLLPTQILWINLATDGIPALALATDTKDPEILNHKPRDPRVPILTKERIFKIVLFGGTLALLLIGIYFLLLQHLDEMRARTIIFNLLILSHMILAFIIRGQSLLRVNKLLLLGTALTIIAQIIITTTPFFQEVFNLAF
ncbi:MAG: cation-translocating P-type ATPase [Candidatus Levybacteria bacterium]|nr:cation-translocating P-type ATPase [Candidatus Levybacteria bacterium]